MELSYEEKMSILNRIEERISDLKAKLYNERVKSGKCPHENVKDTTTMATPKGVRTKLCLDCGKELIMKDGVIVDKD